MRLKHVGIVICVVGSAIAILFPPCKILGTSAGWHFLFESVSLFGSGSGSTEIAHTYDFIDTITLMLELILINGVGLALYFVGAMRKR